ncbi:MAG: N-acetyl-gamma-glutamyl-phosphate reductase [Gammaproteobacteria bacterium]|nr:N-acetyl-gamma-glutamyl-phosphate reductase [Gammaproteobacteria bacterium]
MSKRIGLIGARGHAGAELIRLVSGHPEFELAFVSSRERAGQPVAEHHPEAGGGLRYVEVTPENLASYPADVLILALPNGKAAPFVAAIDATAPATVVLDLSADYRFNPDWYYGLPELTRTHYRGQKRISNPGCYATAMQLAIAPMRDFLSGPAQCFGVSGFSGAGTSPSDKNDPEKLRDNLMPYALTDHIHEREAGERLNWTVQFMPHVAPHFRGLSITANLHLREPMTLHDVRQRFRDFYAGEPLVGVQDDAPWVSAIAGKPGALVGGFTMGEAGRRVVLVSVLDNLLKGAATQALQNLNLAFGFPETQGITAASEG